MSSNEDYLEAQRRIAAARESSAEVLDLGDLQLERLPTGLSSLTCLRVLSLGSDRPRFKNGEGVWEFDEDRPKQETLRDISALSDLPQLRSLNLSECYNLTEIAALSHLPQLHSLYLSWCNSVTDIAALANLPQLQSLDLSHSRNLTNITALAKLPQLQSLKLSGCSNLTDIGALANLPQLKSLSLSSCKKLTGISALANATQLQNLDVCFCDNIVDISSLANLGQLRVLNLMWCRSLTDIAAIEHLQQLQSLNLRGCQDCADIGEIMNLRQLHSLNLSFCHKITDIASLANVDQLQSLNISECRNLTDIAVLATLQQLQSLDLSGCRNLTDISALANLHQLRSLNISRCQNVTDISFLTNLSQLHSLMLSGYENLVDLAAVVNLQELQSLELSGCNNLTDISFLTNLSQLQSLDLTLCRDLSDFTAVANLQKLQLLHLSGCENLVDLTALANLHQLQSLNLSGCENLVDLTGLANLHQLRSLNLSGCTNLTGIVALTHLQQLQSLRLGRCENLIDVAVLANLQQLRSLDMSKCTSVKSITPLLSLLDGLEELRLFECKFHDFPAELCGGEYESVIDAVRAHFEDRNLGESQDIEIKLCIVGNGGVGKTQIGRRVRGLPYDPAVPTTHGVQIGHFERMIDGQSVRFNLWDFGGQDIYHGSHSLFLTGRAVFVVAWTPESEQGVFTEGGATMAHRPLSYWLDYLRGLAGVDSPVLVVQTQCDAASQRKTPDMVAEDFRSLRPLNCSAKTDFGMAVLLGEIEDAVRDIDQRKPPMTIGAGRVEVREQLRTMLEADQKLPSAARQNRTLTLDYFRKLCQANRKISSPDELLNYLHQTGVVFYRAGRFNDRIILDQTWALDAIYTLFDREKTLPILNRHGRFTRRELELLVWKDFSADEQEVFLSMMQSCGICFQVCNRSGNDYDPEWEYLAPELLPTWSVAQDWLLGRMQGGREDASVEVTYRFLHEGILRELLSRLGHEAGDAALYWKYGCWFFEKKTNSQILISSELGIDTGKGNIHLRAVGDRPTELLETVLKVLLQIPCGAAPEVKRSWEPTTSELAREARIADKAEHALLASAEDAPLAIAVHPDLPSGARSSIYISYAWGDDKSDAGKQRSAAVAGLCDKLDAWDYQVIKDEREMRPGDWISTFMKAIGRGDHVLVILSEKYLRSPYCMTELFHIYSRSMGEKEDFLKRIIPVVLDDACDMNEWRWQKDLAEYWEQEFKQMEPALRHLGKEKIERYHLIKLWHGVIGNMLDFIGDTLHPHGFNAITADDYAAVRKMLPPRK